MMAKKTKNLGKRNLRKIKKQKLRAEKIRKNALAQQAQSQPDVEDMVDYALERVEEGDFREGAKILDKLKRKHRNHSYVNYGLGVLSGMKGDSDEAIHYFLKATELSSDFVEAHFNLGVAYQKNFKIPEMVAAYRTVIRIGAPDSDVVHQAQNFLDGIEKRLQDSDGIGLDEYLRGYQVFEHGVKHMQSGNWEAAIVEFNTSMKIAPKHIQSYGNIGICYANIGRIKEALDALDKAIELDPHYELALVNRKIVESLEEGQCLELKVKTVEYYKDYALSNRSYIEEFVAAHKMLPGKKRQIEQNNEVEP